MTQKRSFFRKGLAVAAIVSAAMLLHSCGKEKGVIPSPSYSIAKNFVGYYIGWNSCSNDTADFIINAGADKSMVTIPFYFGNAGCRITPNVNATINGDSIRIPSFHYQDHCFADYIVDGDGIFKNDSIFIEVRVDAPSGKDTCLFYGRKLADTTNNVQ